MGRLAILLMMAGSVGASPASTAAAQAPQRGSVDQIGTPQPVGMQQVPSGPVIAGAPTSATSPQLSSVAESGRPSPQLTRERGARPVSRQLTIGRPTAEPSQPLSAPGDGRTARVERVGGSDRCDPARAERLRTAQCASVIESRAAQFAAPVPAPMSPEQRLLIDQQTRERTRGFGGAARRLAASGDDARSIEAQGVASLVLDAPPPAPKRDGPDQDPAATEQINAIVNAIVNQPPSP